MLKGFHDFRAAGGIHCLEMNPGLIAVHFSKNPAVYLAQEKEREENRDCKNRSGDWIAKPNAHSDRRNHPDRRRRGNALEFIVVFA